MDQRNLSLSFWIYQLFLFARIWFELSALLFQNVKNSHMTVVAMVVLKYILMDSFAWLLVLL